MDASATSCPGVHVDPMHANSLCKQAAEPRLRGHASYRTNFSAASLSPANALPRDVLDIYLDHADVLRRKLQ
eukprot:3958389-Pyramimonas_sp.AAC.1